MSADALRAPDDDPGSPVPTLTPLLVLDEEQAEQVLRVARADLAQLSLQLRAASVPAADDEISAEELDAATVLLQTSLERTLDGRRRKLREDLEQVRADAAAHVAFARHEAATLVADATERTLQALLQGIRPVSSPRLRVVTDDAPAPAPIRDLDDRPDLGEVDDPLSSGQALQVRAPEREVPFEATVERAITAALGAALAASPPVHIAAPLAIDPYVSPPAVAPAPSAPGRSRVRAALHVDVILPVLAMVIVLVVLFAWAG